MKAKYLFAALLMAAPVLAGAASTYEIYTYGNNASYWAVFNGVASIIQNSNYKVLIKVVLMGALMLGLVTTALVKLPAFVTWFLQAIMVYFLLMIPTGTVIVTDRMNGDPPQTIDNVPILLAASAEVTTRAGDWATRTFETAFGVPDGMKLSQVGMRFGQKTLDLTAGASILDNELRNDLTIFFRNCLMPELAQGTINTNDLIGAGATDPWGKIFLGVNPARLTTILSMSTPIVAGCMDAAVGGSTNVASVTTAQSLNDRLEKAITASSKLLGRMLDPKLTDPTIAQAKYEASITLFNNNLLNDFSSTATDTIKRFAFVNYWKQSGGKIPAMLNDPAGTQLAVAQTVAQQQALNSYKVAGFLAKDTLPIIRNMIEMMILALFPLMLIMMIAAGDKAVMLFRSYLAGLVWVALWPPLYAIVNYFGLQFDARELQAVLAASGGVPAAVTADALRMQIAYTDGVTSQLIVSIPFIAGAIVKGFDMANVHVASQLFAPMQSAAGHAGGSMATGNMSLGKVSTPDFESAPEGGQRRLYSGGLGIEYGKSGGVTSSSGQNFSITSGAAVRRSLETGQEAAREASLKNSSSMGSGVDAAFRQTNDLLKSRSVRDAIGDRTTTTSESADAKNFHNVQSAAKRLAEAAGVSEGEVYSAGLGTGGLPIIAGRMTKEARADKRTQAAIETLSQDNIDKALSYSSRVAVAAEGQHQDETSAAGGSRLSADLSKTKQYREKVDASTAEMQQYRKSIREVESGGVQYDRRIEEQVVGAMARDMQGDVAARTIGRAKMGDRASMDVVDAYANRVVGQEVTRLTGQFQKPEDVTAAAGVANREQVGKESDVRAAGAAFISTVASAQLAAGVNPAASNAARVSALRQGALDENGLQATAIDNGGGDVGRREKALEGEVNARRERSEAPLLMAARTAAGGAAMLINQAGDKALVTEPLQGAPATVGLSELKHTQSSFGSGVPPEPPFNQRIAFLQQPVPSSASSEASRAAVKAADDVASGDQVRADTKAAPGVPPDQASGQVIQGQQALPSQK